MITHPDAERITLDDNLKAVPSLIGRCFECNALTFPLITVERVCAFGRLVVEGQMCRRCIDLDRASG